MDETQGLAKRSITSTMYNVGGSAITTVIGLVRMILLARLLEPATFGVYTFVVSVVGVTAAMPNQVVVRSSISPVAPAALAGSGSTSSAINSGSEGRAVNILIGLSFGPSLWAVV